MARSIAEAQQELDRLNTMYRSLPDQRDAAAVKLAQRIQSVQQEIVKLSASAAQTSKRKSSGFSLATVFTVVLVVGLGAFLVGYFGLAAGS
jgi:uncharacterized small protein (DUF1192 family)